MGAALRSLAHLHLKIRVICFLEISNILIIIAETRTGTEFVPAALLHESGDFWRQLSNL